MNRPDHLPEPGNREYILDMRRVNTVALLLIIPETLLFALPFFLVWGVNILTVLRFKSFLFLFLFIVLGAAVHELLHGLAWALSTGTGFRYIRFGVKWEYLTPYCHYYESMKVWQYVVGGMAPLIIMGIIPATWSLFTGNALVMFFGLFFTWAAGGDIQAVWMIRKFHRNQLVYDHPEELGFIIKDQ